MVFFYTDLSQPTSGKRKRQSAVANLPDCPLLDVPPDLEDKRLKMWLGQEEVTFLPSQWDKYWPFCHNLFIPTGKERTGK